MMDEKLFVGSLILVVILCYGACDMNGVEYYKPEALATHFNGEQFVGTRTCMECHSDVYESHLLTAHYNTSAVAKSSNIKGSFDTGANTINLEDSKIEMRSMRGSYFQEVQLEEEENEKASPLLQKMDIVIGSGIKGQSFLTWEDEKLFQLQASYSPPADKWINSPGFPEHLIKRPIRDGCLKCHVTFATNMDFAGQGNRYNSEKMIYGIGCEKCHRPSEKHVVFHRENPEIKTSRHMLKLDTLSRQFRLDVCAQCHSGSRAAILKGNSFSFLSGERLDEYSRNFYTGQKESDLDVHGNQYGLLRSSQCFKQSLEMDCGTCHNPHMNQRGDTDYFNQKCATCHTANTTNCSAETNELHEIGDNCIACHMPTIPSKAMALQVGAGSKQTGVLVRTHLIGIYALEDDFIKQMDSTSRNNIIGFIESQ
ncbi:MAG: LSD1 subclass zinc finger protein [Saprospiraceae bacterium]|jgi:LSD1 subclass zinc finger protein